MVVKDDIKDMATKSDIKPLLTLIGSYEVRAKNIEEILLKDHKPRIVDLEKEVYKNIFEKRTSYVLFFVKKVKILLLVNLSTNKLYFIDIYFPLTLASIEVLVKIVEAQIYLQLPNCTSKSQFENPTRSSNAPPPLATMRISTF